MRHLFICIFCFCMSFTYGQFSEPVDTLFYTNRIGGRLDSIDLSNSNGTSTIDGGVRLLSLNGLSLTELKDKITQTYFLRPYQYSPIIFSALPHVGFAYNFGGQGTQNVTVNYSQAFTPKTLINIDYRKSNSSGYLRNSNYNLNSLQLKFNYQSLRYALILRSHFDLNKVQHSGGVSSSSLIGLFDLGFIPVNNISASSNSKSASVKLDHYLNFSNDSITQYGLTIENDYQILNREFIDDQVYLYPDLLQFAKDSTRTRDQLNLPSITNGAGFYYKNKTLYFDGKVLDKYWLYQNVGKYKDTNEIWLNSKARYSNKGLLVLNQFDLNLIGGFNEIRNQFSTIYKRDNLMIKASSDFHNQAPIPYKRNYISNYFDFNLSDIQLIKSSLTQFKVAYSLLDNQLQVGLSADYLAVNNPLVFEDSIWVYGTAINAFQPGGLLNFELGPLNIRSEFKYTLINNQLIPKVQTFNRIYLKGKLFKAKKLEALFGAEVNYSNSYSIMAYNGIVDQFIFNANYGQMGDFLNVNAFASLGIEEFRFFVRYDNIGYFWTNPNYFIVKGYPLMEPRLSIGITWDFFN